MTHDEQIQALIEAGGKANQSTWGYFESNEQPRGEIREVRNNSIKGRLFTVSGACHVDLWEQAKKNGHFTVIAANSREAIKALVKERDELREAQTWRPIDHENMHHPFEKDILGTDGYYDVFSCYQSVNGWFLTQSGEKILPPTHWMPLPKYLKKGGDDDSY